MQLDTIDELALKINMHTLELNDVVKIIKDLDQEIMANDTPENRLYMEQTIQRYDKLVDKTRILLEAYFAEEQKAGLPADFMFRLLYKKIKEVS